MASAYNYIYKTLVEDDNDILGIIAYGIYKKHKIEFIDKIKKEQGREPTDEECYSFFACSTTETQLESYRSQAEMLLSEAVGNIAREEIVEFEKEMLKNYKKEISSCVPSNMKTFWLSAIAGVVSTLLFTIIAGIFYFIGGTSDRDTHDKVQQVIETIQKPASQDSIMVNN